MALLPECPSVFQNVCVVTCLHLVLFARLLYLSRRFLPPASDVCLLPFAWLFLCTRRVPAGAFSCTYSTFPAPQRRFLSPPSPALPEGPLPVHPSQTWSSLCLHHPSLFLTSSKEHLPVWGKRGSKKVKEGVGRDRLWN